MTNRSFFVAPLCTALLLSWSCADRHGSDRARAAAAHRANAEAALEKGEFARASAAAELASAYDPLDPSLRDLVLRIKLTALASAPQSIQVDRPVDFDYQAESMVERDPARAYVYKTARGYLALARNDEASAEALYRDAIKQQGSWAPVHVALGQLLSRQHKRDEAAASFEQALKLEPKSGPALAGLGKALLEKGELDRALETLQKAVELTDGAAVRLDLAGAFMAKQKMREAGENLQKAVAMEPRNGEAHLRLGDWLFTVGQADAARQELEKASQLGAEPLATYGLGMVYAQAKDFGRAAKLFDAVINAAPQLGAALYQGALAHENAGEPADAARLYGRYIQVAGQVPAERGRVEDAQARLTKLAVVSPSEKRLPKGPSQR